MFRELFDTAPDAMIVVDREGNIVRANPQAERLFGFPENELHGRAIELLMPGRAHAAHRRHRADYAANSRVRPMGTGQELVGLKRGGEEFPVEIALSPINTPEGKLFVASIRDISETQRARQALTRARYDAVVTQIGQFALSAPDIDLAVQRTPELVADALNVAAVGVVFLHAQRRQPQVRAEFGLPPEVRDALPSILSPPDCKEPILALEGPLMIENLAEFTATIDGPTLSRSGFHSALSVLLVDRNEVTAALVALSATPRRFDRDAMYFLQSVANLLGAAMQRIRMEEQLSHAQRLEAVGQLTGGIAHDFNNLLTIISGNLQILEGELTDHPLAHELIGSALRAVGRGAELTGKLLAFARRQRLSPSACAPQRLLGELSALLKRTLGETIALEFSCADDVPAVFADAGQLEAALVNLALNSRDAMPRGGRLDITAAKFEQSQTSADGELMAGDYVAFTVRDSGFGMSPEVLARAFEPFFTTKDLGKGSGLGLSMVYGFVKQSGGHLSVDSQLGYGTTIALHLPVVSSQHTKVSEPAATAQPRGHETVLVVEDEDEVRGIALAFLRSAGYTVIAAENAEAALELIARPDIALVFSDVVLGSGMSGVELAHEARRRRPRIPVLLTSGYEHAAPGADAGAASQFKLLPKPYTRQDLAAAVRQVLDLDCNR
jgi:PAS domain S-box-containing protein